MVLLPSEFACAEDSKELEAMLMDLFAGAENMHTVARSWRRGFLKDNSTGARGESPPWLDWNKVAAVRHPVESLWVRLTRLLFERRMLPLSVTRGELNTRVFSNTCTGTGCLPGVPRLGPAGSNSMAGSVHRAIVERWAEELGGHLPGRRSPVSFGARCVETGDGHYLHRNFQGRCGHMLAVDIDPGGNRAELNLDIPPNRASKAITLIHGRTDFVLSIDVFEHLQHPAVGVANVNMLLGVGGLFALAVPLIAWDHITYSYADFHRFTILGARRLLECGGFRVDDLRGVGTALGAAAYLLGITTFDLGNDLNIFETCDGKPLPSKCHQHLYQAVVALGTKLYNVSSSDVSLCFAR
eukprot:TRINITY_DN6446_c0_g1_i1.p1 TRINITY_DN6446_c0_g1~~TRINITY_DN6446_c0_g1_i1.p1  ORF type:complete len:379 (-),score=32.26 TRINITY_DN6446_c0_g1_i1:395-1459(-)